MKLRLMMLLMVLALALTMTACNGESDTPTTGSTGTTGTSGTTQTTETTETTQSTETTQTTQSTETTQSTQTTQSTDTSENEDPGQGEEKITVSLTVGTKTESYEAPVGVTLGEFFTLFADAFDGKTFAEYEWKVGDADATADTVLTDGAGITATIPSSGGDDDGGGKDWTEEDSKRY